MVTAKLKKEQFYLSKFIANSVIKAAETNSTLLAKQAKTNQRENDYGSRTRDKRKLFYISISGPFISYGMLNSL